MLKRILTGILLSAIICIQIFSEGIFFAAEISDNQRAVSSDTDIDVDIGDEDEPDPIKPDPVKPGTGGENSGESLAGSVTITLSDSTIIIPKGKSVSVTASVIPQSTLLTWKTSDASVAEVENGKITGKKGGKAIITVQANGVKAECEVTVAEVSLNAKFTVLQVGTSSSALQIEKKYPGSDKVKSYKSSNAKIVKINKKGKITAGRKTGKAVITVTMESGASASCKITVQKKAVKTQKLTLSRKKLSLKKGEKAVLYAMRKPVTAAEKITWTSSNRAIAAVNQKGVVKARKKGKVKLTAKTDNGKKAVCSLTVK